MRLALAILLVIAHCAVARAGESKKLRRGPARADRSGEQGLGRADREDAGFAARGEVQSRWKETILSDSLQKTPGICDKLHRTGPHLRLASGFRRRIHSGHSERASRLTTKLEL